MKLKAFLKKREEKKQRERESHLIYEAYAPQTLGRRPNDPSRR